MATVYLETTIPSYLAAKPSRDLVSAAHQQITHEWWETAQERFEMYVSEAVLSELRAGDPQIAAKRLDLVRSFRVLSYSSDVETLVHLYASRLGLAGAGVIDVPHFAFAVAYGMDYLVTWNCRHIANGEVIKRLTLLNRDLGRHTPIIVTPEELLVAYPGKED
jgi:hypothetical protein